MTFRCFGKSKVKWTKLEGHIRSDHYMFNNILIIENITEKDSGIYQCKGKLRKTKSFKAQSELLVGGKQAIM